MPITLTNAILFHLDPIRIESGAIRIDGPTISAAGPNAVAQPGDEIIDCGGAVVLPGLVNGHTHLYSALATGMPMPPVAPKNFHEILKFIWWRLDRALDAESIEMSARIGALDALSCGTTTLIDHHASPNWIDGSLDLVEKGIRDVGLRAVLCYETTDRNGMAGFEAGLAENRRYLEKCRNRRDGHFAALVGAHAAFTLSDASLRACVELAEEYATGVHIHVAEDPCDDTICRGQYGSPLLDRLYNCGLIPKDTAGAAPANSRCHPADNHVGSHVLSRSILGHGTHLSPSDAARISAMAAGIAHNPRSNMNNAVGYAPVPHMSRVLLGTDGIGGDMFTEAKTAWFKFRDSREKGNVTPGRIVEMLAYNARVASRPLNRTLGRLEPGAAADIVVTDYIPATPLTTENAAAHFLFAIAAPNVHCVLVNGQIIMASRAVFRIRANRIRAIEGTTTRDLWNRMEKIPLDG